MLGSRHKILCHHIIQTYKNMWMGNDNKNEYLYWKRVLHYMLFHLHIMHKITAMIMTEMRKAFSKKLHTDVKAINFIFEQIDFFFLLSVMIWIKDRLSWIMLIILLWRKDEKCKISIFISADIRELSFVFRGESFKVKYEKRLKWACEHVWKRKT